MKTRDKIIHASLELFNEHGERAITTNHIAAHLGISPGNLYYHFRNKQDIIQSIFSLYEGHLEENFQPLQQGVISPERLVNYFDAIFYSLWQFRFLYANLSDILQKDESLKQRYHAIQGKVMASGQSIIRQLVNNGILTIPEDDLERFADTLKMIVASWISYRLSQSTHSHIEKPELYDGVSRVIMLTKIYATPNAKQAFEQLERRYIELSHSHQ
ncbi:TetR/AcrR family transcriptional regulator [Parashewanella tropica]|uniref:TetR/AcrR family transcriptional regulator n=1 Tax=Parashewanella tropica TaxID=2547970 RepID=UPI0010599165|nr:TetR/AcrR family transcriptional regulator [Parashewanella tropica]